MDEVSELCLNIGDSVNNLDDLYTCMDGDSFHNVDGSRSPGLISWAFSPITESDNNCEDFSFVIPEPAASEAKTSKVEQPIRDLQKTKSTNQEVECHTEYHQQPMQYNQSVNQSSRQISSQMNNYSEYIYPNNITYHHSVNIHNYVGNYCNPAWWDNQQFNMLQHGYDKKVPSPYVQMIEQTCESMVTPNPSAEFTRCSTPDYLLALNALKQLDSPPRPNLSAAMTFPPITQHDKSILERSSPQQDSGYNSDLNLSPVIQYQDQIKLRRHTSTPNPIPNTYPVLHHSSVQPSPRPSPRPPTPHCPQRYILPSYKPVIPSCPDKIKVEPTKEQILQQIKPKVPMCPDNMKPEEIKEHIYKALQNKISAPLSTAVHTHLPHSIPDRTPSNEKLMSVADYQLQKKIEIEKKHKLKSEHTTSTKRKAESDLKPNSDSGNSSKKRRHNEPLNQRALEVMNNWYQTNNENPYPNKAEKELIAKEGGISISQVKSWFANKRNRSNNTRPKKQKKEMEGRLMEICHQLARDAAKPNKDNAYYIQQLSSILH